MNNNIPKRNDGQKRKTFGIFMAGIVFICLIIIAFIMLNPNRSDGERMPSNTVISITPTPINIISVSAVDLCKAYQENEVNADLIYKGKMLEVTGTVEEIGKDMFDNAYVRLSNGEAYSSIYVYCLFKSNDELPKVASLKKGDEVVVIGECSGTTLECPSIKNCKIK